jgi:hypothetical protein
MKYIKTIQKLSLGLVRQECFTVKINKWCRLMRGYRKAYREPININHINYLFKHHTLTFNYYENKIKKMHA